MIRIFSFSFWGSTEKTTETRLSWVSSRCHCVYVLLVAFSVFKDSLKKKKKKAWQYRGRREGQLEVKRRGGEGEAPFEGKWMTDQTKENFSLPTKTLSAMRSRWMRRAYIFDRKGRSDLLWLCVHTRGCVHIIGGCCFVCECAK